MGHKVNPQIFRLGISVDWKYQLRDPLLANIFIYKLVKNLMTQYTVPYTTYSVRRTVNPRDISALAIEINKSTTQLTERDINALYTQKKKMILNPFLENSFIFSHLNISYAPSLYIAIFLLDAEAESERIEKRLPENTFYYLSGKFYHKYRRFYYFFRKDISFNIKKPYKKGTRLYYHYKFVLQFLASRSLVQTRRKLSLHRFKSIIIPSLKQKQLKLVIKCPRHEDHKETMFPTWLINNFNYNSYKHRLNNIIKNLRILRFLLRYLKYYKRLLSKKRLFFFNTIIVSITCLLAILPHNSFSRRLILFLNLCYMYLFSFRYLNLQYNTKIFQSRLYLYRLYSQIITFSLKKISFYKSSHLMLRFYGLHNRNLNANFLLNYFIVKLGQYFILNDILEPIVHRLKSLPQMRGFRLIFSGRLTRKERAAYIVKSFKSMPLSTYKVKVDYASDFKIMKFGVVGIKIYLLIDETPPYYYFFEFRNLL
jgi:hypothetical protein